MDNADAGKTLIVTARLHRPGRKLLIAITAMVTVGASEGPAFSSATATAKVNENTPTPVRRSERTPQRAVRRTLVYTVPDVATFTIGIQARGR